MTGEREGTAISYDTAKPDTQTREVLRLLDTKPVIWAAKSCQGHVSRPVRLIRMLCPASGPLFKLGLLAFWCTDDCAEALADSAGNQS